MKKTTENIVQKVALNLTAQILKAKYAIFNIFYVCMAMLHITTIKKKSQQKFSFISQFTYFFTVQILKPNYVKSHKER